MKPDSVTARHSSRAHWLNRARLRAYCATFLLACPIFVIHNAWFNWKKFGMPNGLDFATFWAAARLTIAGRPLDAWSRDALGHIALAISPKTPALAPWFYPPNFLLIVRPLGWLPCIAAYALFSLGTTWIFVRLLRRVLPMREAWLPMLGFTGLWLNIAQGQNGALTACFALGALLLLPERPVLAGICIAMLSIKPQLAILFPVALACAGMWTAFFSAAVATALFTGMAIAMFGIAAIPAFLHAMTEANHFIAQGILPWDQMASVFIALRMLHVPVGIAYAAQGLAALTALVGVAWVWRRSHHHALRATALVAGTFMVSPYIYNYDTVWLAIALALFAAHSLRTGWLKGEREVLVATWLYPVAGTVCAHYLHLVLGPFAFSALLFVAVRRARHELAVQDVSRVAAPSRAPATHPVESYGR